MFSKTSAIMAREGHFAKYRLRMNITCSACKSKSVPLLSTITECRCPNCDAILDVSEFFWILELLLLLATFYYFSEKGNGTALVLITIVSLITLTTGNMIAALLGLLQEKK